MFWKICSNLDRNVGNQQTYCEYDIPNHLWNVWCIIQSNVSHDRTIKYKYIHIEQLVNVNFLVDDSKSLILSFFIVI